MFFVHSYKSLCEIQLFLLKCEKQFLFFSKTKRPLNRAFLKTEVFGFVYRFNTPPDFSHEKNMKKVFEKKFHFLQFSILEFQSKKQVFLFKTQNFVNNKKKRKKEWIFLLKQN